VNSRRNETVTSGESAIIFMSTGELNDKEDASDAPDERFNGAELSESVLGRDWNSPEEDTAWSNL
jgi:hypothetical protein